LLCLLFALVTSSVSFPAASLVITDHLTFETSGQSLWGPGAATGTGETKELFIGTRWGRFDSTARIPLAEVIEGGSIVGEERFQVPGTGGMISNPARIAWDVAFAACTVLRTATQCISGTPAVKTCLPSWLGGGCTTIVPAIPGLGNAPPAEIDNPIGSQFIDTRTGVVAGLRTSGEAGLIPWIKTSGGAVDVTLPVRATLGMPDVITTNASFTVTSSLLLKDGASITANAPFLKAGVDGFINTENSLSWTACGLGFGCTADSREIDVAPGRFGIVSFDTSRDKMLGVLGKAEGVDALGVPVPIVFNKQYVQYTPTPTNPDGVDDEITPQTIPSTRLGDYTFGRLNNFTGGALENGELALTTNQTLLSANISLTGAGELFLGSPGTLSNKLEIPLPFSKPLPEKIEFQYTFLDVAIGPRFGVQQDFAFTPDVWVELDFDRPVTRVSDGSVDDTIEFKLGEDVELRFDGEVGNLVERTFFMKDPRFSNSTAATAAPGLKIEAGCLQVTFVLSLFCVIREDFTPEELVLTLPPIVDQEWTLAGFNRVSLVTPQETPGVPAPAPLLLMGSALLLMGCRRGHGRAARI
jgi:hypothetical protein